MEGLRSGVNAVCMNSPVMLIMVIITIHQVSLWAVAQEAGFVSIDCGSSELRNYTDSSGIQWTPDATIWPNIGIWASAVAVSPSNYFPDQKQYTTLRYFPTISKALYESKFCYTLPATGGTYYLIRASFWMGSTQSYSTRVSGQIRFRVIVDSYEGVEVVINFPQTLPWFEEMYIPAQSGKSSVSVCLSAASDSSDVPFINTLELRPLPSTMKSVETIKNTNYALRTIVREDSGISSSDPPILRYPDDAIDRFWWRLQYLEENTLMTNQTIDVESYDLPPEAVMQTNYFANGTSSTFNPSRASGVLTTSTVLGRHYYFAVLWFVELNPNVTSGMRVFNLFINGQVLKDAVDIYSQVGRYTAYEIYSSTNKALGPYVDSIILESQALPSSTHYPTLAAIEIFQLFDKPINTTTPTSSTDVSAIQEVITKTLPTLQNFIGDPCLPQAYKHPWIDCDYTDSLNPTRVTSLLLSNYSLVGNIPSSISSLDQLVRLDLSNNKLTGTIPDSLSNLPKLEYLNLANNTLSGTIPQALLQKQGLDFRYEGNNILCNSNNGDCQPSTKPKIVLIIGATIGSVLFVLIIITAILCIVKRRKNRENVTPKSQLVQTATYKYEDPHVNVDEKVLIKKEDIIDATNIAHQFTYQEMSIATDNFSTLLGQGGSGLVYKGNLPNGLDVAIKIISHPSQQGSQEFLNEVTLLSRVHHKNLVGFVGYSIERSLMLVYEFMSNGSLHDALSRRKASRTLTWPQRLQILCDAAEGLTYLHDGCNIIHRDVKTSNILLSSNLEGKMSDFGISKLTSNDASNTTRIVGTMGYLDPEYASTLRLTKKVDIYSFGVVILEAICGKLPIVSKDANLKNVDVYIVEWVRPSFEQGIIEEVVDERLKDEYNLSSLWKVAEVAMACVQHEGIRRPTMYNVCNELREAIIMESNHEASPMVMEAIPSIYSNVQAR